MSNQNFNFTFGLCVKDRCVVWIRFLKLFVRCQVLSWISWIKLFSASRCLVSSNSQSLLPSCADTMERQQIYLCLGVCVPTLLVSHLKISTSEISILMGLNGATNEQNQPFIIKKKTFGGTLFYLYTKSLNVLVDYNKAIVFNVVVCCMRTEKSRGNFGMDNKSICLAMSKGQDLKLQQHSIHVTHCFKLTFSLSCW